MINVGIVGLGSFPARWVRQASVDREMAQLLPTGDVIWAFVRANYFETCCVDKNGRPETEIEEKRLARAAEVNGLTRQTQHTAWQEKIRLNREVQRKAKVVERVSLEEEEAVKKRFDAIERDALADLSVML